MANDKQQVYMRKAATYTGASLIVMTLLSFLIFPTLKADVYHIIGIAFIIILDLVIAWYLYVYLATAHRNLAIVSSSLRAIYAIFFAIALSQIADLSAFTSIWETSLLLFGFHLLFLGLAILKASYIPKIIGYVVLLSSIGYIIDGTGIVLGYSSQIGLFTFWGEVVFAFWLVIKGNKALSDR